jgi:hypothetical protein
MFCLGVPVKEIAFHTRLDNATIDYHLTSEQRKRKVPDREALRRSVLRQRFFRTKGKRWFHKRAAWDEKARNKALEILVKRAARLKRIT